MAEPRGVRVLVVAEHVLVGESVRTALLTRGHAPVVLRIGARRVAGHPEVGLLVTHSYDGASRWVSALLARSDVPWLVLAPEDRGPGWGSFYASGASFVLPPSAGLDEVCDLLARLADGHGPSLRSGSGELIREWQRQLRDRDALTDRLETLTAREHQVLRELYAGVAVRSIAQGNEVTEATVRTQVKAILRKLGVASQVAAVAAYVRVQN